MKTSQDGLSLIKHAEGLRLKPYYCPAGKLTVGYGHVILPGEDSLKKGISEAMADSLLAKDVGKFEEAVTRLVKVKLKQCQFDALVSFTFNLGEGNLARSTLLKRLNAGYYKMAAEQFLRWNRSNKVVLAGLTKRREAERQLFLKG